MQIRSLHCPRERIPCRSMTSSPTHLITTDRRVADPQRRMLAVLADLMIPAEGELPSAADDAIMQEVLRELESRATVVVRGLDHLVMITAAAHATEFTQLDTNDQVALIDRLRHEDAEFLRCFETVIAACYYRDDRVLGAHGLTAGAPFPNGRTVAPTDWTLLDPVRTRQPFFKIP
jgi:Gluconate 2-dehydrogenase subunit 3